MFCTKCGNQIMSGAKFCVKCGAAVTQPVSGENAARPVEETPSFEARTPKKNKPWKVLIIVVFVLVLAIGAVVLIASQLGQWGTTQDDDENIEDEDLEESTESDYSYNVPSTQTQETFSPENLTEETPTGDIDTEAVSDNGEAGAEAEETQGGESVDYYAVHRYEIVIADVHWTEAYQLAMTVPNGHLVHINSEEEFQVITDQICEEGYQDIIFWLGGMRQGDSEEYYWIGNDGNVYGDVLNSSSHWLENEPSIYDQDLGTAEKYMDMFYRKSEDRWVWNDVPNELIELAPFYSGKVGYIVEIEE